MTLKKILTLIILCAAAIVAQTQAKGYEFTYQEKVDIGQQLNQLDESMRAAMQSFLSKRKSFYTLTFADGKSYFEKNKKISDDDMGMGQSMPTLYVDFGKQEQTSLVQFFGRNFLVDDTMSRMNWVMDTATKTVAGLHCLKATYADSNSTVTVWFSTETPIPAGPYTFYGLPGLVTEVEMGPVTYTLTQIKVLDAKPTIEKPKKGKKVTQEELQNIIKTKLEEMGFGGGEGTQIMRF